MEKVGKNYICERGIKVLEEKQGILMHVPVHCDFGSEDIRNQTIINRIDSVALDNTFTESAKLRIQNGAETETNLTNDGESELMRPTENVNYVFNQGMSYDMWANHFSTTAGLVQDLTKQGVYTEGRSDLIQQKLSDMSTDILKTHDQVLRSTGDRFYKESWDGITYFTDKTLHWAPYVDSKIKIAIILENIHICEHLNPNPYNLIKNLENDFDLIFTYSHKLLERDPEKYRFFIPYISTIEVGSHNIHEKKKMASMFVSEKRQLNGHQIRHVIANSLISHIDLPYDVDLYGSGVNNPVTFKSEGCNDYMFQIATENTKLTNYLTDKILDCFITGTVPIYWGCPNIGDYFDERGIITFDRPHDLKEILKNLNEKKYDSMLKYIKTNFEIAKEKYTNSDDYIFRRIVEDLSLSF
mgnify:CR=1 FL=1